VSAASDYLDTFGQARISVTPLGGDTQGEATREPTPVPAPTGTGLANYRKRAKALREARFLDLRVPDSGDPTVKWDPEAVFVRFRALTRSEMTTLSERWDTKSLAEKEWGMAVDALTATCLGVFQVDERGYPVGVPSSWPRFGPELAEEMGITLSGSPAEQASQLLREFYVTEVDVVDTADHLAKYSNRVGAPVVERQNPEG